MGTCLKRMGSEMETQCWICPYCFDDHGMNDGCKQSDLKDTINKLRAVLIKTPTELHTISDAVTAMGFGPIRKTQMPKEDK